MAGVGNTWRRHDPRRLLLLCVVCFLIAFPLLEIFSGLADVVRLHIPVWDFFQFLQIPLGNVVESQCVLANYSKSSVQYSKIPHWDVIKS